MNFSNEIYIVRHGESQNNVLFIESGKMETQAKYGLTDMGRGQVAASASKYKDFFDLIYTSPFRRTKETAEIFARFSNIEFFENELIREFDVGHYDEKSYDLMEAYIHHEINNIYENPVRDGESWLMMYARVTQFFELLETHYTDKKILIVSHGSPVETMLQIAKGEKNGFGAFGDLPKNAEVIKLESI